jgi:hypothetical protein
MKVTAQTIKNEQMEFDFTLSSYLNGCVSSNLARQHSDMFPDEVLENCLPYNYQELQGEELRQALSGALRHAGTYEVEEEANTPQYIVPVEVEVSDEDIADFKISFFENRGLQLLDLSNVGNGDDNPPMAA